MRTIWIVALVLVLAAGATAQAPPNDPAAWQELVAAYQRLAQAKSYRVRMGPPGQPPTTLLEVVNPDRYRAVTQQGSSVIEAISVAGDVRTRTVGPQESDWRCAGQMPFLVAAFLTLKPGEQQGNVVVARLPDGTIEGAATKSYEIQSTSGPAVRVRLHILADIGLPRRVEILEAPMVGAAVADFTDYDAPIRIELPQCET